MAEPVEQIDASAALRYLREITKGWDELGEPAVIELRCLFPGRTPDIRNFHPTEEGFADLVAHAEAMNRAGLQTYVVVNPIRASIGRRPCNDNDIIAAFFFWADGDDDEAANSIRNFAGPKWTFAVTTGRVPSPRPHIYWRIEDGPVRNLAAWTGVQKAIAARLSTDPSVVNPSRIMRLPGFVNWPTDKKKEKGRIAEVSTLRTEYEDDRDPVPFDRMRTVFGSVDAARAADSGFAVDIGPQPMDRLQAIHNALTDKNWNVEVFRLVGSYCRKGLADDEIHAITDRLTLPGYTLADTRREVQGMIDRTRSNPEFAVEPQRLDIPVLDDAPHPPDANADWQDELIRNSRGRALWNVANAMRVMQNDPNLRDCFAFDEFRQVKMLTQPLPYSGERKSSFKGREIRDSDITKVVSYFNRIGYPGASKSVTADVIEAVGEMATFHPVRNYLNDLPTWDGVARVETWLMDYCAVSPNDQDHARYISEVGKRWLISAVARVLMPGCKADGVLILEGRQGAMKSTTLRTIAGADWFGDSLPPMHSKDASDYLRGKWVIEMAELSNMNKAEVEVVKAFIAREEERFRPAYGRNEISYPRQCVFAGSTNKTDYLRDETGNRRFWPVKVGQSCDVQSLGRDRDQIWAETLSMFKDGEIWWLTGDVLKVAEGQQAARVSQDAWEGDILQYVAMREEVSCATIARDVLNIEVGRVDRAATNRISAILTGNGWVRDGQFTAGAEKGRARYIKNGGE